MDPSAHLDLEPQGTQGCRLLTDSSHSWAQVPSASQRWKQLEGACSRSHRACLCLPHPLWLLLPLGPSIPLQTCL